MFSPKSIAANNLAWKLFNRCVWAPSLRFREHRSEVVRDRIIGRFTLPAAVAAGPFLGLRYPFLTSCCSTLLPKLLGTYESELHDVILRWSNVPFKEIIDIGSAEGYYAVGLARMFPDAVVTAYDISPEAQLLTSRLAEENFTRSRTTVSGSCSREDLLARSFTGPTFLLSDCEGYEIILFDEAVVDHLKNCHCIIELHDKPEAGFFARSHLLPIFEKTHQVMIVSSLDDDQKARYYRSDVLTDDPLERQIGFAEKRPSTMDWLVCEPLEHRSA